MSANQSALYKSQIMHRRLKPKQHRLSYKVFFLLLDLDEIDGLSRRLKFFSRNRFNLFSHYDADYGNGSSTPLRCQIEDQMKEAGLKPDGGSIKLFTMPRILGYAFNPISIYFCYTQNQTLTAIVYEVNNTFGGRHTYFFSLKNEESPPLRHDCSKRLHVSPFLSMDLKYSFRVLPPGERAAIFIITKDDTGPILFAALSATRAALTDAALARAFVVYPLLTLKVIAGIHWEAFLIWMKGIRLHKNPDPPLRPITYIRSPDA